MGLPAAPSLPPDLLSTRHLHHDRGRAAGSPGSVAGGGWGLHPPPLGPVCWAGQRRPRRGGPPGHQGGRCAAAGAQASLPLHHACGGGRRRAGAAAASGRSGWELSVSELWTRAHRIATRPWLRTQADEAYDCPALRVLRERYPTLSPFLSTVLLMLAEAARVRRWRRVRGTVWPTGRPPSGSCERAQPSASRPPHAHAQGAESKFHPYLQLLPPTHDCLMSWSEEERAELRGTGEGAAAVRHGTARDG